ncbi:MAG: hypothetical protein ACREND_16955 [Gemmatimonadaceae bacterium]
MDTVLALANDSVELVDPHLRAVIELARAPRHETTVMHGEDERVEEFLVASVEGNVNEDRVGRTHKCVSAWLTFLARGLLPVGGPFGRAIPFLARRRAVDGRPDTEVAKVALYK